MKHGFVDYRKTTSTNQPDSGYIRIKADTSDILQYILDDGTVHNFGATSSTKQIDTFTLTSTDISNGYLTLSQTIDTSEHIEVNMMGSILFEGALEDYTATGTTLTFTASQIALLEVGDRFQIKYYY